MKKPSTIEAKKQLSLSSQPSQLQRQLKINDLKVAMFHMGRSGSTVLGDLLNQHPHIFWDSEIYQGARMKPLPGIVIRQLKKRPQLIINVRQMRTRKPIYGFETKFQHLNGLQMNLSNYINILEAIDFSHFIILERKNYLRRIASHLIGVANKTWHHKQNQTHQKKITQIHIDTQNLILNRKTNTLLGHLNEQFENFEIAKELLKNKNLLLLNYEDDVFKNPKIGFEKMCAFLELEKVSVSVRLRKTNPFPLYEIITNFEDVQQALNGTKYEWMLS